MQLLSVPDSFFVCYDYWKNRSIDQTDLGQQSDTAVELVFFIEPEWKVVVRLQNIGSVLLYNVRRLVCASPGMQHPFVTSLGKCVSKSSWQTRFLSFKNVAPSSVS